MAYKQGTMKSIRTLDGVSGIATSIFFWCAHVALCIDSVIVSPIGWWRNCHTCFEHRAPFTHAHQGVKTTETPSPNAYTLLINVALLAQP